MATQEAQATTLPQTFGAAAQYVWGAAGATLLGALAAGYVMPHARLPGVVLWAMTGLYLLLAALMWSLRIRLSADGLAQRWLFSTNNVAWDQVARLDRTPRFYALLGPDDKELVLLRFLPTGAQQQIADEAIARARLRKSATPPKLPVIEQWERKK